MTKAVPASGSGDKLLLSKIGGAGMDVREQIINRVMLSVQNLVSIEICTAIQDVLSVELNRYEVTERCTDVATVDDSVDVLLKNFAVVKSLEGVANSTIKRYLSENKKLLDFLRMPVEKITTNDIRVYLASRRKADVSNRTLDGMRRCYSSFFGWLQKENIITNNPCAGLKQIKYKKEIKKPYSAVDLEKMRMGCKTKRDLALVSFLYSTGCRVSEVCRLNLTDIDFEKQECTVLGKGDKERVVYLSDVALMHLKEYLAERNDESEALFVGKGTGRLSKSGIEAMLKRLEKSTGVKNVHPHRFRRTLATNLLDRGMNIQDVAEILGHADLKTTQIYCFISRENVKSSYRKYAL